MNTSLQSFLRKCECEQFLENFLDEEVTFEEALEIEEEEELIDFIPNKQARLKFLKNSKEYKKDNSQKDPGSLVKLKEFLQECKCIKFLPNFTKNQISFEDLKNLSKKEVEKYIPSKFFQKRFFKKHRNQFKEADISIAELISIVKKKFNNNLLKKFKFYINPKGSYEINDENEQFDALEKVQEFINDENKLVLLLLGSAGSGKSMLGNKIQWNLLNKGENINHIPLFMNLTSFEDPTKNILQKFLIDQLCLGKNEARYVMYNYPLLLILDGYDEVHERYLKNLYRLNLLSNYSNLKVIITCRSSALFYISAKRDYKELFAPTDENGYRFDMLQQIELRPFDQNLIKQYISLFIKCNDVKFTVKECMNIIKKEKIEFLFSNPFLLFVGLDSIGVIFRKEDDNNERITRYNLYESFLQRWFMRERSKKKEFVENEVQKFSRRIAIELLKNDVNSFFFTKEILDAQLIGFEEFSDNEKKWISFFLEMSEEFETKENVINLISTLPLSRVSESYYSFLHKSFWEFICAETILDDIKNSTSIEHANKNLNKMLLNSEMSIILFIVDVIKNDKVMKNKMVDIIKHSRIHKQSSIASANAATILNYSLFSFSKLDFSSVNISGADLHQSILHGTNFSNSNLDNVILKRAILTEAMFKNCSMAGCKFGEVSSLKHENAEIVLNFKYSKCGKYIASIGMHGNVYIWNAKTSKIILKKIFGRGSFALSCYSWNYDVNNTCSMLAFGVNSKIIILNEFDGFQKEYVINMIPVKMKTTINNNTTKGIGSFGRKMINVNEIQCLKWNTIGNELFCVTLKGYLAIKMWKENKFYKHSLESLLGHQIRTLDKFNYSIEIHSSGNMFAASFLNGNIEIWKKNKSENWKILKILKEKNENVTKMKWNNSQDNHILVVSGKESLYMRNINDEKHTILCKERVVCFELDSNIEPARYIVASCIDGTLKLWDITNKFKCRILFDDKSHIIGHISWHKNPRKLLFATIDQNSTGYSSCKLWDGRNGFKKYKNVYINFKDFPHCFLWNPNIDKFIIAQTNNSTIERMLIESGSFLNCKKKEKSVIEYFSWDSIEKEPSMLNIVCESNVGFCSNFYLSRKSVQNGEELRRKFLCSSDEFRKVEVSFAQNHSNGLLAIYYCSQIFLYDLKDDKIICLKGHSDTITCAAWNNNIPITLLASGGEDKKILIWKIKCNDSDNNIKHEKIQLADKKFNVKCLKFLPCNYNNTLSNNKRVSLVSGSLREVIIWTFEDIENSNIFSCKIFKGHRFTVNNLAYNSSLNLIASAGGDNSIRIWENKTNSQKSKKIGVPAYCISVNWSNSGKFLAGTVGKCVEESSNPKESVFVWKVSNDYELLYKSSGFDIISLPIFSHDNYFMYCENDIVMFVKVVNEKKVIPILQTSVGTRIKYYKNKIVKNDKNINELFIYCGVFCCNNTVRVYKYKVIQKEEDAIVIMEQGLIHASDMNLSARNCVLENTIISSLSAEMLKQKGAICKSYKDSIVYISERAKEESNAIKNWAYLKDVGMSKFQKKKKNENVVEKFAFVVGNSNYFDFSKLPNAINDAKKVKEGLENLGFDCTYVEDLDSDDLIDEFDVFCTKIQEKRNPNLRNRLVVVVFYAGHGIFFHGTEFLIPIDIKKKYFSVECSRNKKAKDVVSAQKSREKKISVKCLSLKKMKSILSSIGGCQIFFFDACRELCKVNFKNEKSPSNAATYNTRVKGERELSRSIYNSCDYEKNMLKYKRSGSITSFSTKRGSVSLDGKGNNSIYTLTLCELLNKKMKLVSIFKELNKKVSEGSNFNQIPVLEVECLDLLEMVL